MLQIKQKQNKIEGGLFHFMLQINYLIILLRIANFIFNSFFLLSNYKDLIMIATKMHKIFRTSKRCHEEMNRNTIEAHTYYLDLVMDHSFQCSEKSLINQLKISQSFPHKVLKK